VPQIDSWFFLLLLLLLFLLLFFFLLLAFGKEASHVRHLRRWGGLNGRYSSKGDADFSKVDPLNQMNH
jgi:hypothetical protein